MISHNKKFIFLHLPKTGGTSINSSLSSYCKHPANDSNSGAFSKHARIETMYNNIGKDKFDEYFKFTIVRNPWDRILSLYFWGTQIKPNRGIQQNWITEDNFSSWIKTTFVKDKLYQIWPNQIDLMSMNKKNTIDFTGRFENLETDWNYICNKLGVDNELKFLYSTKHKPYYEYYDTESIEIINKFYTNDIKTFNYEFQK
jgi:hypothetical protein